MTESLENKATTSHGAGKAVLAVLLLSALGAGGWVFWQHQLKNEAQAGKNRGGPVSVRVARAEKKPLILAYTALGTVTPLASVTVRSQINGQLMRLGFEEGQKVEAGAFLAEIDPRPYQNDLAQAEGALQKDRALLQDAKGTLARYEKLAKQDSLSQQQLDTQASLVAQFEGDIKTDEGKIEAAKLNLAYCHVVAPMAGRVGLRQVDPGNYVTTADTAGLVSLTQTQPISVLFTLPEDDLPALQATRGTPLEVEAYDRDKSARLATGKLIAIDNAIDKSTGTIKLRALFENEGEKLFPNQFVNVRLLADKIEDALLVPTAAIQRGQNGSFVYKLMDGNKVAQQNVTTGPSDGDAISITQGLAAGDQIVIDGLDKLRDGKEVTPTLQDPPAKSDQAGAPTP